MKHVRLLCLTCVISFFGRPCLSGDAGAQADWPSFRGSDRSGRSADKGLLASWPKDGPPLAWSEPARGLGSGFSSVSVVADKIFTMGDQDAGCFLLALDRASGRKLWQTRVGNAGAPGGYEGPRCTPSVADGLVFALGQFGDLVCARAADGKVQWRKNLPSDFGGADGSWGYSESPLVDGDKLICSPGGGNAMVVALNKSTGEAFWQTPLSGDAAGYSSVVIANVGGIRHYVTLLANSAVGVAADDGRLLWRHGQGRDRFGGNTANIPTCIVQDDHVFVVAGYGRGGALLKLTARDNRVTATEVYYHSDLKNRHGGVVLVGDHLYGDRDHSGQPYCAEMVSGKIAPGWGKDLKKQGRGSACVTYADGHLYFRYQNGVVALVEADPAAYREKGVFQIPQGNGPSWSHPVVVGGTLYLRDQDLLWTYDVRRQ